MLYFWCCCVSGVVIVCVFVGDGYPSEFVENMYGLIEIEAFADHMSKYSQ